MSARTALIMAGGTGGHIMPALAVAERLRGEGWHVVWLGTRAGMEARLVPARGFAVEWLGFAGVRGKGPLRLVLLPLQILRAFWQAARAIFRVRPDVVLGFGGYVAFPGGMMAALLNKPLAIHEQNSVAGMSNRVLAHVADRVLLGLPLASPLTPRASRETWVGNPVRPEIAALPEPAQRYAEHQGPLRLLVVGGSLGAAALNDAVPKAMALLPEDKRPLIRHQAGAKHIEQLQANYAAAGVAADCLAFIDDMAAAYAWADVVICRAGALTVAEVAAAGVPAAFVPFPFAVDDHQTANARFLSERGAAWLLPQKELTPEGLAQWLQALTREALIAMAAKARALGKPDAAERVADVCKELAR
ncbi:MAG: undecaprenyldiphospho-muramoylpentapeptide beta-N-acetylglucosaminyltransferase [Betaproteobacteria bacterium]|nr:undecaprenyldiphospho-muramoylpentapeptide beta-N-acetylglucosaminyltransferase [Betaproteobacteria bacterium]